ncbi:MAG: peptidoglycan editing factor PgeF [Alphaproteobacteria bacterium]|nr:peptidoglycan editing factor PgeF [Alphaproteobacteria bacterium]
MITVDALSNLAGIRHGFFTRTAGASDGIYASNNCAFGSSDDAAMVARNRAACAARLGAPAEALVTVKQKHTPDVVVVDRAWTWHDAPVADALVTRVPQLAIGILTADCVPILLADPAQRVIAAVHAGWKGAFGGVIAAALTAMARLGASPERIVAAIGPAIGQGSYEVGPEFMARFTAHDRAFAKYFTPPKPNGHTHFNLIDFVRDRLINAGIGKVVGGTWDTCAREDLFFSYRRATLRGEPDYGRQLSAIALSGSAS